MAAKTIKGITVEIGGNTTKLTEAIDGVTRTSINLQGELKQVNKLHQHLCRFHISAFYWQTVRDESGLCDG